MVKVGGLRSFPLPKIRRIGRDLGEMVVPTPGPRCVVWRQLSLPGATVGVLKVPLKGYRYSSGFVCQV